MGDIINLHPDHIRKEVQKLAEELLTDETMNEDGASEESFLFDDYFADPNDKGIEVTIEHKGKKLPFRVVRALGILERQKANAASIKITLDKNGKPKMEGQPNQSAYTVEIVLAGLKFWPFEYKPGKPVPINRQTVAALDGALTDKIASRILGVTDVDETVLDPSERKSEEG